jgi:hypothetical protein
MLLAALALALAQDAPQPVLAGRVLAPDGAPARGRVFLVDANPGWGRAPFVEHRELDREGAFELSPPAAWVGRAGYKSLTLGVVSAGAWLSFTPVDARALPVGRALDVQLERGAPGTLRVLGPDGAPLAGARVSVAQLAEPTSRALFVAHELHATVLRPLAVVTDARGVAPITTWDPARTRAVRVETEAYGVQTIELGWSDDGPLTGDVQLLAPDTLVLRWTGAGAPPALDVEVRGYAQLGEDVNRDRRVSTVARVRIDAEAREARCLLVGGAPHLTVRSADPRALELDVRPAEPAGADLVYTLAPAASLGSVRARVVEEASGAPLEGVELVVSAHPVQVPLRTGPDGTVAFRPRPGQARLQDVAAPRGFVVPEPLGPGWAAERVEPAGETDLGDLPLARGRALCGTVLDEQGRPVAGAWVVASFSVQHERFTTEGFATAATDARGAFVLAGAPASTRVVLEARHGGALTLEPVEATDAPLVLTIVELARPRGRLVDARGLPVAGAELIFWTKTPTNLIGGERRVTFGAATSLRADAAGTFHGPPGLKSGDEYCVVVRAPGCAELRTPYMSGAELARGFELTLTRTATFAGTLCGEDGRPRAGVELRLRGAGTTTWTDAEGHFELPGVGPFGDVALAELEDGAVFATRALADEEARWVLRGPSSETPLRRAPPAPRDVELATAHALLRERYEDALASGDEHRVLRALQALAWADPAFVLDAVQRGAVKSEWSSMVLAQAVFALRRESPDEALAVAERMDDAYASAMYVMNVLDTLPASARAERLEHLALARAKARQIQGPAHQLIIFSWVAERLLALEEDDAARAVFAEGRAIAAHLPTDEWSGFARAAFAEELAVVDLDAALELVEELASKDDRSRHWGNIAHKLAARDPAGAERVLGMVGRGGGFWSPRRYVARVAYSMAPADLERARGIAARDDRTGFSDGMIALALADADPDEARRSLATAFERMRAADDDGQHPPILVGAALLDVVERLAPDELERRLWQVLALPRPRVSESSLDGDQRSWQADGMLAFHAARWDRALARQLLEPAVRAARERGARALRSEWRPVWAAVAVTDVAWAAEVARALGGDAQATIGKVLAVPPAERRAHVQDEYMHLWVVGKEDI